MGCPMSPTDGEERVKRELRVVIGGDARPVRRDLRALDARVDDVANPRCRDRMRRLLSPATVVRKALGEFDAE